MIPGVERVIETRAGAVPATFDEGASESLLILAHGAGAGRAHPFMAHVAEGLAARGVSVLRFDFLYIGEGRRAPDRQPALESTFTDVVATTRELFPSRRLFLGGKSLGGRIATHLAAGGVSNDGLVILGYPLHPPGRPDRIRDQHLYDLMDPILFVAGTRDPFCPLPLLEEVRAKMKAPTSLAVVEDGDHSFRVRKSSGRTNDQALDEAVTAVIRWTERVSR